MGSWRVLFGVGIVEDVSSGGSHECRCVFESRECPTRVLLDVLGQNLVEIEVEDLT